ncbi:unnamed protein product [Aphanomyces euteiches]|nr:hypothetical protein Ae201684P_005448 [Aphanomyces euteiches]KAH9135613.1 hypothetical protein AeRB84_019031 [Aphanomyces euteiches]
MESLRLIHGVTMLEKRFLYRRHLGTGTSSIVVLAMDTLTKKNVAIKIWHKALSAAGEREVDVLELVADKRPSAGLPIVQLYGSFYYKDHLCIVMERVGLPIRLRPRSSPEAPTSMSLSAIELAVDSHAVCTARPQMDRNKLRQIIFQTCAALAFVHSLTLIHADVKPDNILCDNSVVEGSVKLIDFGNAMYNSEAAELVSAHEYDVQTMLYRAPEVAVGASLTTAADMWSVGCILLEGVLGTPPFLTHTRSTLLAQIDQLVPVTFSQGLYLNEFATYRKKVELKPVSLDDLLTRFGIAVDKERDLVSFLRSCLTVDPVNRLTAAQVLPPRCQFMMTISFSKGCCPSIPVASKPRKLFDYPQEISCNRERLVA